MQIQNKTNIQQIHISQNMNYEISIKYKIKYGYLLVLFIIVLNLSEHIVFFLSESISTFGGILYYKLLFRISDSDSVYFSVYMIIS